MTTYRTGNAIGSADPRDLYDNAENLDELVNSQDKAEHPDRLGVPRKTWHGMEEEFDGDQARRESEFVDAQADKQLRFNAFIAASGYTGTGTGGAVEDYTAGIEITEYNQIIRDPANGEFWRLSGATPLPYTTDGTGLPEGGALVGLGDAVLRQELSQPEGAALVAGGSIIYRPSVQQLFSLDASVLEEGQSAKVRGTEFVWSGTEWEPVSNIYVNSWGARGDAPFREQGTGTNSRQAFIDAADYAHQHGHKYVFAEPGIYYAPDLLASEMHDLYVVGDGVQFTHALSSTNSGHAQIQALTTQDYSNGVGWGSRKNTGRGRIAFEFDDGLQTQFSTLMPLFKKYGVPYGISYHTASDRPWIREVFRHGNEILAHFPGHADSTTLTRQQLEDNATADLDAIEAITGYRDGVNFVYPAHNRNAETDDVLSQFYASGRGLASNIMTTPSFFGSWLCSAWNIDSLLTSGNLSDIFSRLKTLRDNDLDLVFYAHDIDATRANNLEAIIEYALHLGIEITLPRNLKPTYQMLSDRYFKDFENYTGDGVWDTSVHSEFGTRSRKFSYTGTGSASVRLDYEPIIYIRSKKDFSKLRVSFLYKTAQELTFQPITVTAGISFNSTYWRLSGGGAVSNGGPSSNHLRLPMPPSDFDNRISFYVYVPRTISRFQFGINVANFIQPAEFWIDDLRVEKIDEVDSVYLRGKLIYAGAAGTRAIPDDTDVIGGLGVDFDSSYSAISTMDGAMRKDRLLARTDNALDEGKEVQAVVSLIRGHTG